MSSLRAYLDSRWAAAVTTVLLFGLVAAAAVVAEVGWAAGGQVGYLALRAAAVIPLTTALAQALTGRWRQLISNTLLLGPAALLVAVILGSLVLCAIPWQTARMLGAGWVPLHLLTNATRALRRTTAPPL